MEIQTMLAGYSVLRDLKGVWDSLDDTNQKRLEAVVAKAVEKFVPADDPEVCKVREHLLSDNGTFVERISLAALHPGTKKFFSQRLANGKKNQSTVHMSASALPNDIMVQCLNCGMSKAVHLHDDDVVEGVLPD
jgi:hypothetical protein